MKIALFLIPASLMMAGTAQAQDAPAQQTPPAETPAQGVSQVSDQEVERFALAALLLQSIAQDDEIPQEHKQAAMAEVLTHTGVEPERFNEIVVASETDPELTQRIEVAAAAHVQAAQQQQQQNQ